MTEGLRTERGVASEVEGNYKISPYLPYAG